MQQLSYWDTAPELMHKAISHLVTVCENVCALVREVVVDDIHSCISLGHIV